MGLNLGVFVFFFFLVELFAPPVGGSVPICFPIIKITVVRQVHICLHVTRSDRENKQSQNTPRHAKIVSAFVLRLFLCVWSAKTRRPPNWAQWLTKPLQGVVYDVEDLWCIYVDSTTLYTCTPTHPNTCNHPTPPHRASQMHIEKAPSNHLHTSLNFHYPN